MSSFRVYQQPGCSTQVVNELVNGGFEDGNTSPTGWWTYAYDPESIRYDWGDGEAKAGLKSVKISSTIPNDGRWQQTVDVEPNSDYRLSGWIKTENVAHTTESEDVGANLSIASTRTHTPALIGTHDWTYVSVIFNRAEHTGYRRGAARILVGHDLGNGLVR